MSQSRKGSAVEAAVNVLVGLAVSMVANATVFPLFGFNPTLADNAAITLARSYLLRRMFNHLGGSHG